MSLNIEDFHENDFGLNLAWSDSANGKDRDLILWQGYCPEGGGECYIRLHPVHFPLLAKELGLVTAQEAARHVERMRDRLNLLAALVRAHSPNASPLRMAADALLNTPAPIVQDKREDEHDRFHVHEAESADLFGEPPRAISEKSGANHG